jgi:protein TIF31
MNNILKTDPFCMSHTNLPTREWVVEANASKNFIECFKSNNEEATSGFYGLDSKGSRDWNEEFQVCKDLPKDNVFQRIQRDRAFYKIYYDFIEAARKGAVAIVNKSIPALNPMDEELQHVFVYNQIFFSFAIDNKESFKDVSSTDSNPSYTATNHDVLGLRSLQVIDIDGLHIIATCHVNYKGYRVIAQSIIPGILTNTDQRNYTSCLIRPELVRIYQKTKDLEYASEKLKQFDSENPEEEKKQTLGEKNFQDMTEEEKKEAIQERNKENEEIKKKRIERLTKFDQYLKEAPQFNYNLNVFTNANLAPGDYKEDEKAIRNLSNFINENVIPKVNKIFESGENVPTDSESLTSFMHSQGLNVRYLGKLVSSIEDGKLPHIRTLIERCIVCR